MEVLEACHVLCAIYPSQESLIRTSAKVPAKSILYITNMEHLEIQSNRCWWGAWLVHRSIWQRCIQALALFSGFLVLADSFVGRDVKYDSKPVWVRRMPQGWIYLFIYLVIFLWKLPRKQSSYDAQQTRRRYTGYGNTIAGSIFKCTSSRFLQQREQTFPQKYLPAAILKMKYKDSCLHCGSHASLFHSLFFFTTCNMN